MIAPDDIDRDIDLVFARLLENSIGIKKTVDEIESFQADKGTSEEFQKLTKRIDRLADAIQWLCDTNMKMIYQSLQSLEREKASAK